MTLSPRHGAALLLPCRRAKVSSGTAVAAEDREEQGTAAAAEDRCRGPGVTGYRRCCRGPLPRTGSRRVPLLPRTHGHHRPQLIQNTCSHSKIADLKEGLSNTTLFIGNRCGPFLGRGPIIYRSRTVCRELLPCLRRTAGFFYFFEKEDG
jgi:hypothetical protein